MEERKAKKIRGEEGIEHREPETEGGKEENERLRFGSLIGRDRGIQWGNENWKIGGGITMPFFVFKNIDVIVILQHQHINSNRLMF